MDTNKIHAVESMAQFLKDKGLSEQDVRFIFLSFYQDIAGLNKILKLYYGDTDGNIYKSLVKDTNEHINVIYPAPIGK